jgi:hypothetical protein
MELKLQRYKHLIFFPRCMCSHLILLRILKKKKSARLIKMEARMQFRQIPDINLVKKGKNKLAHVK